jgi:NAD(P)-dependent dehydrogenase (short-subunit alcohol dehydrogenase family)
METSKTKIIEILPALRMLLSEDSLKVVRIVDASIAARAEIEVDASADSSLVIAALKDAIAIYKKNSDQEIKHISLEGIGVVAVEDTAENISGRATGKTAIITGGAQGFGGGLVELLFKDGANVVIADLNKEKGEVYAAELNKSSKGNKALFVKVDVSNFESVENLIYATVCEFGGFDVFISNAGILHAGGLDEMDPATFELITKVNYTGYFLCAKAASKVLKIQTENSTGYYGDIIQINSKSGLKGSNKNFAYAGGKFGGIGLTQSFAMELMPSRIKVNSICPGNFFDGPLWSDPEKGLFVQYLKAGKVKGAKCIEDVKAFYEAQVPAGRGCTVLDVMRAVYYIMEQEYETGQAIPVTGGQEMLK